MEPVRPAYDGAWIGGLVPVLLGARRAGWLPDPVADAAGVVLFVLDGLGWEALQEHRQRTPTMAGMEGGPITAAVPTTTAAGLTSIATGATPGEHGVVGYRMRIGGEVLNVLRWEVAGNGWLPDPTAVQPLPPFLGHSVPVVSRAEFRRTGFTGAHLRGSELIGWRTTSTLVEHCRRLAAARKPFVYAYYDGVDKVAHEYGLRSGFFAAELEAADGLVAELLDALPDDCAVLVTADHGQVHVDPDNVFGLGELSPMVAAYAGEPRFRSLHASPGAAADLFDAARECHGDKAWVFRRDQLFDEGWLGRGATAAVRGRVGDVVLAARDSVAFLDPHSPQEAGMRSHHGSITGEELMVPLLAARGRS
jgi:hypothetical protein